MAEIRHPRIVIALPALNEARSIGTLVLKARQYGDEVIVLDDGSTDGTADVARLAGAAVIRHPENRGKGAAIQTIFREAAKNPPDVLVLLDADYQHDPDQIPDLIQPVLDGGDIVIGSRQGVKDSIPFYRRIGQKVLLVGTRTLSQTQVTDSESGYRAFSRKAVEQLDLRETGFAVETEMIMLAADKGLSIAEVPITVTYGGDTSTLNPVRHGLGVLGKIVVMISERRPLFFFGLLGLVMLAAGLVFSVRTVQLFNANSILPVGTLMLGAVLLIIGILSVFTGLILNALTRSRT